MFAAPSYPTPVRAWPELGNSRVELWLKNDGLSHPLYGGNKVRKAERLVAEAAARGAQRVLSFGAAGSHHLLTLTLFARAAGLSSAGLLVPQRRTVHAVQTLRAALGAGLEAHAVAHPSLLPLATARVLRRGDYVVPPGGSNAIGAGAFAAAVEELVEQVSGGALPMPDWIVVPLGSGGTCGGIAAGVISCGLSCRVLGVQVLGGSAPRFAARWLAREVLRRRGCFRLTERLSTQLVFDVQHVGSGYGIASAVGDHASSIARELGLELESTYTAKTFAKVLELLKHGAQVPTSTGARPLRVLYWHTLAAGSLEPLLRGAPREEELPLALRRLFR